MIACFQVPNGGHERPAAMRNPRLHPADGLLSALIVIERAETRHDCLDQFAAGRLVNRLRHGSQLNAVTGESSTHSEMFLRIAHVP
jgi:hypothetical protein